MSAAGAPAEDSSPARRVRGPVVSEETVNGWRFRSVSAPIASSSRIEEVERALGLPAGVPLPEALFADNVVEVFAPAGGLALRIDALGALRSWNERQGRVAAASGSAIGATSFDWTYRNDYEGDLSVGEWSEPAATGDGLPMELLRAREDIAWSCSLSLFEDDLHDIGVCECTVKARVMPSCFLVLLRTFIRLDGERCALHETRYCHAFGAPSLLRDVQEREASAQQVLTGGAAGAAPWAAAAAPTPPAAHAPAAAAEPTTSPFAPKPEQKAARATGARFAYDAERVRAACPAATHTVHATRMDA